jgi:MraZ protein
MLAGSYPAKVDQKFRLKIPAKFRRELEEMGHTSFYVTSEDGRCGKIYPEAVWKGLAEKLKEPPRMAPAKIRLERNLDYYGVSTQMDSQGRVLIPLFLREDAQIAGEVLVIGRLDHLEVWNIEIFRKDLKEQPLTDADREKLAEYGF